MKEFLLQYNRPLLFILKFVGIYVVLNILYALLIESYNPSPDPATSMVTAQTSIILNLLNEETIYEVRKNVPYVHLSNNSDRVILSVYEGCNALNVIIIFIAFLVALPFGKKLLWFIPLGIIVIHISNLLRIALLYYVSLSIPESMYFVHKYLFTAFLFAIVFALWYWYVKAHLLFVENE